MNEDTVFDGLEALHWLAHFITAGAGLCIGLGIGRLIQTGGLW